MELANHGQDHGYCLAGGDLAPGLLHLRCTGEYGPHHGRGRTRRLAGITTLFNGPTHSVGATHLASPGRIQPAPDVAFLGVLEPHRGDSAAPDRQSRRDGAYYSHHG